MRGLMTSPAAKHGSRHIEGGLGWMSLVVAMLDEAGCRRRIPVVQAFMHDASGNEPAIIGSPCLCYPPVRLDPSTVFKRPGHGEPLPGYSATDESRLCMSRLTA